MFCLKSYILSVCIFSPFVGVLLLVLIALFSVYNAHNERSAKPFGRVWPVCIGIFSSCLPLVIILYLLFGEIDYKTLHEQKTLINFINLNYSLSVDGLSLLMMGLTAFITPVCLLIFFSNKAYSLNRPIFGVIMMLLTEVSCLGAFATSDLILFYIFFEFSLIPMFFIIGIWGGQRKIYASMKLFIYTAFGSIFFLSAAIYLNLMLGSTEVADLQKLIIQLPHSLQVYLWLAMFIAFAIKVPMLPFHTWLPDAHSQAPTFGSVLLAAILIKLGAYGMLQFLLPIFPEISHEFSKYVLLLSALAIIYGSFVSFAQKDLKKLIAYSSIAHMGYTTLGIFTQTAIGYAGAAFQMVSHGIISAALFIGVGVIYEKLHTLEIIKINSLANKMPFFAFLFMIATLGAIGLPGTSGFVGEFLVIMNSFSFTSSMYYGILAATGVVFGAIYMLILYKKLFMNQGDQVADMKMGGLEGSVLAIFALLIIYFGLNSSAVIAQLQTDNIQIFHEGQR